MKKSILIHKRDNYTTNIIWSPPLSNEQKNLLKCSLTELTHLGYWASPFPEGDGVTLDKKDYVNATALADIVKCFSWLDLEEVLEQSSIAEAIKKLNINRKIELRYFVPAERLLIYDDIVMGPYKIHRPVVPYDYPASKHSLSDYLLDVVGADVDPSWDPREAPEDSHARLLQYPLIEGKIIIDAFLLYPTGSGTTEWEPLTLQVTDHADRVIDILRHDYCHYKIPHYAPHHAGVLADREFRIAYLIPDCTDIKPQLIAAKSSVFEVVNVWLGLELDRPPRGRERLAYIASGAIENEIDGKIRNALRIKGQSFLVSNNELKFLSMIFASDSVACVGQKAGERHRKHIAAAASGGEQRLYDEIIVEISSLYILRNRIVHSGSSFLEMDIDTSDVLQRADRVLSLCIENSLSSGASTVQELSDIVETRLASFGTL